MQQQGRLEQEEQGYEVDHDAQAHGGNRGFHRFGPGDGASEKRGGTDWRGYSREHGVVDDKEVHGDGIQPAHFNDRRGQGDGEKNIGNDGQPGHAHDETGDDAEQDHHKHVVAAQAHQA